MPVCAGELFTVTRGQNTMAWFLFTICFFCCLANEKVKPENTMTTIPSQNAIRLTETLFVKIKNPRKIKNRIKDPILIADHVSVGYLLVTDVFQRKKNG